MYWGKRKKHKELPNLKTRSFLESAWITNFWMIDDLIYFTDADLIKPVSSLCTVSFENLKSFLLNQKNSFHGEFFNHPHQLVSSPVKAEASGLKFYRFFDGYIYNLNEIKEQLLVSLIKAGDTGGAYYNARLVYQDIVLLGFLKHKLIGKSIVDKRTLLIEDAHNYKIASEDIKKICQIHEGVYLNNKNQIIYKKHVVFESMDEITIATYSPTKILVSEKRTQKLFILSGSNFQDRKNIWQGNYFYQLCVFDEQVIVGKPLYDQQKYINYGLPMVFIY